MTIIPCMGGWCPRREQCAHYHSTAQMYPAERLCPKDSEYPEPMRVIPIKEAA